MSRFTEHLKDNLQELGGQAKGAFREGAKDLWNNIVPAFPGQVHAVDELGTPLSPTQIMVNRDLGSVQGIDNLLDSYAQRGAGREQEQGQGIER